MRKKSENLNKVLSKSFQNRVPSFRDATNFDKTHFPRHVSFHFGKISPKHGKKKLFSKIRIFLGNSTDINPKQDIFIYLFLPFRFGEILTKFHLNKSKVKFYLSKTISFRGNPSGHWQHRWREGPGGM
jgi:hypothetical protein